MSYTLFPSLNPTASASAPRNRARCQTELPPISPSEFVEPALLGRLPTQSSSAQL